MAQTPGFLFSLIAGEAVSAPYFSHIPSCSDPPILASRLLLYLEPWLCRVFPGMLFLQVLSGLAPLLP